MRTAISAVAAVAVLIIGINYVPTAISRTFDRQTRLGLFEERISNIPAEFARRSPDFAAAWEDFKSCMDRGGCDAKPILVRRNAAIRADWPAVFDRLTVERDWGAAYASASSRRDFFDALGKEGASLRTQCVPKISFRRMPGVTGAPFYSMDGYDCQPDPKRSG